MLSYLICRQYQEHYHQGGTICHRQALKLRSKAAAVLLLWLLGLTPCIASVPHVNLPPVNLGQTNFLDGIGGPGFLLEEWLEYYAPPRFAGTGGRSLPGANSFSTILSLTHVAYTTKFRILNGFYGVEATWV
jgi:hypothetical protein